LLLVVYQSLSIPGYLLREPYCGFNFLRHFSLFLWWVLAFQLLCGLIIKFTTLPIRMRFESGVMDLPTILLSILTFGSSDLLLI
jgi:hypothetical protein